jgi:hypothetical protein
MSHLTSTSKCLVVSYNLFVLPISATLRVCSKFVRSADEASGSYVVRTLTTASLDFVKRRLRGVRKSA